MSKIRRWTDEELKALSDSNGKLTINEISHLIKSRTKGAIVSKMKTLSIEPLKTQNRWNSEDIEILLTCSNMKLEDIQSLFPHRLIENIKSKAYELGIKLTPINSWLSEEDQLLIVNSNGKLALEEISELLQNRTVSAIKGRMQKLGLSYMAGTSRKGITKTPNFSKKTAIVYNYKIKYEIDLDFELGVDTHDSIQWWKWNYYGTPNNKTLDSLPIQFYKNESEDDLLKIIRYVLLDEFKYVNREDFFSLSITSLRKYKIYFKKLFPDGICHVLDRAFPEHKFKPFEFNNVPLGYWQDKNNCDEYMRYIVEEKVVVSQLHSIKNEIPNIFTFSGLRELKYSGLTYAVSVHRHYDSFYEWLDHLYPEWNLTSEDFSESYGFDGVKLNSGEEVTVYNLLKRDLHLDVSATGIGKRFKFRDEGKNTSYVPDFLIVYKRRHIIVEHFGLYREKYGNSKILEAYFYKTIDKINYFDSLKDYQFISIFPEELKDINKLKNRILDALKGGE